jgi:hypothetical protein
VARRGRGRGAWAVEDGGRWVGSGQGREASLQARRCGWVGRDGASFCSRSRFSAQRSPPVWHQSRRPLVHWRGRFKYDVTRAVGGMVVGG